MKAKVICKSGVMVNGKHVKKGETVDLPASDVKYMAHHGQVEVVEDKKAEK